MQKFYALINPSTGQLLQVGTTGANADLDLEFNSNPEYPVLVVETTELKDVTTTRYDLETQEFFTVPAQPGPNYVWVNGAWQDQTPVDKKWQEVRRIRDAILQQTDWVVVRAAESNLQIAPVFLAYRQALRDVTLQSDPFNITWPQRPAGPIFVE